MEKMAFLLDERARVVFDTDAGVDDAVALLMALHGFPAGSVVGVTTVFGNVDLHQANHNMKHILEAMGHTELPIYSGAAKPIIASVSGEKWGGHGPDGFGGQTGVVDASAAASASRKNAAVHALLDLSHKHKGQLVVIAVGPLTNVALAMLMDPDFVDNVKRFVVMGGLSRGEGNQTPHTEFNVSCDPEATNIVYEHCVGRPEKLLVVPFETTKDFALPWSVFEELFAHKSTPISDYIHRIWSFTKSFSSYNFMPCDAYAVAPLLHADYITKARVLKGHIHLGLDEERGANRWSEEEDLPDANVTLITHVDKDIFIELLRRLAA